MSAARLDEESIFHVARKIESDELRSEYLEQVTAGDPALLARVQVLLDAERQEATFLQAAPGGIADTADIPMSELTGTEIGKYKLMEQIGEGGMGVVYVAQQQRPMRRSVALKIIKPGMDTKEVIGRFEAERQALALMDHPNIAQVLDAGTTDSGLPYFVMELVKGIPITEYCDLNKQSTEERLQLFIKVCQAVQHAHQKGIIHRDLKPTNVLITEHDGTPVPKVIDFGVAKAINQRLTEHTLYTCFRQMVGTPLYMSPEQAELSGLDVDTRADIYSLGVLLYELLTGATPFDKERFGEVAYDEIRRIIREEEPPKPSTKISTLGKTAGTVSAQRRTEPRQLSQLLSGELDWIVMRALEKDRNRRYETAAGFAVDVKRYLDNEPIVARPPSTSYRVRKFIVRNKGLVVSTGLVVFFFLLGILGLASGMLQAKHAQHEAEDAQHDAEDAQRDAEQARQVAEEKSAAAQYEAKRRLQTLSRLKGVLIQIALQHALNGEEEETLARVDEAIEAGASPAWKPMLKGQLHLYGDDTTEAVRLLKDAVKLDPENVAAQGMLTTAYMFAGIPHADRGQFAKLLRMQPKEPEDYLFKGQALAMYEHKDALPLIEEAMKRRDSPMVRAISAHVLGHRAIDTNNIGMSQRALSDIQAAHVFLPKNRFVQMIKTSVHHSAFNLRVPGIDRSRMLEVLKEPTNNGKYSVAYLVRGWCFHELDMYEEAVTEYQKAAKYGDWWGAIATIAFEEDRTELASNVLSDLEESRGQMLARSVYRLALEMCKSKVRADFESLAGSKIDLLSNEEKSQICWGLLFAGQLEKARVLATKRADGPLRKANLFSDLALIASQESDMDAFLRKKRVDSTWERVLAYHTAGMIALAKADRLLAVQYFRKAVEAKNFFGSGYYESKAFLKRLNEDPDWPAWIPQKNKAASYSRE